MMTSEIEPIEDTEQPAQWDANDALRAMTVSEPSLSEKEPEREVFPSANAPSTSAPTGAQGGGGTGFKVSRLGCA